MSLALCAIVPAASFAGGKPSSCGTDVTNLRVTIVDESGYNITSDGNKDYFSTKSNKVAVGFQVSNCSYDFTMNLFGSSRTINVSGLTRTDLFPPDGTTTSGFFNFDRIASVPITPISSTDLYHAAFVSWCSGGVDWNPADRTINLNGEGNRQDAYAPCGVDDNGKYFARRAAGFGLPDQYGLRFQNSSIDSNFRVGNDTVFIKVYHPTPNTWELVPDTAVWHWNRYPTENYHFIESFPNWILDDTTIGEILTENPGEAALTYSPNGGTYSSINHETLPFRILVTKP